MDKVTKFEVSYDKWKEEIDNLLIAKVGLDMDCFHDWLSREAYDNGMSADHAVDKILETTEIEYFLFDEA
jgi:predicted DsbA family dithiol-disulfide isomerase